LPGLSCYDFAKHSRSARVSIAGKLLIVSGALIGVLVVLAALNERTLPLFGGDRSLAARVMLTTFSLFGGLALALAQPAFWRGLSRLVQTRVAQGGSQSDMAQWLLRPELRDTAQTLGFILMGLFTSAAVVFAWLQWTGLG
jgi:hypothetical protein